MTKKKIGKVKKESKEDVKSLLLHLESEYRKANISEKHYKELKEKYQKMLGESKIEKKEIRNIHKKPKEVEEVEKEPEVEEELGKVEEQAKKEISEEKPPEKKGGFLKSLFGKKEAEVKTEIDPPKAEDPPKASKKEKEEEEITEITPEVIERLAQQAKEEAEGKTEESVEEGKKPGLLKSIFSKKGKQEIKEPQEQVQEQPQMQPQTVSETTSEYSTERYKPGGVDYGVEIEKIKVMIDTIRESGKLTDESVRNLSESIGEIRSMIFQTDAELKEDAVKMEKVEDEISEVKPEEIAKKLREIDETFGKQQLELEKLGRKAEDSGEKINRVFEILKSIGGIENLVSINTDIQKKLDDINEAMKYVERIGMKTEKMFIDLNKGVQDLVIIRSQQDDFNEGLKDIIKNIDSLNVKFEGYVTKKDLDSFREDNMLIKKEIEEIKKVLPVAELKLPENIINLRKEREDIKMLLDSLEDQRTAGKISRNEYESIKDANVKRLEEIRSLLENEWKNVENLIKPTEGGAEGVVEEKKTEEESEKPKEVEEVEKEPEVEEELGKVEEQAKKEISEEKPPEKKGGFLKSLFGKKEAEVKTEEVKKETETKKEVPHPKEVKHKEKKKLKKKIKVKPRKVKAPKKKVIKPKTAKKVSQNEKARKLQILKDIKRMH
jgi:hypothetical protein